jgi:hypothetical protein
MNPPDTVLVFLLEHAEHSGKALCGCIVISYGSGLQEAQPIIGRQSVESLIAGQARRGGVGQAELVLVLPELGIVHIVARRIGPSEHEKQFQLEPSTIAAEDEDLGAQQHIVQGDAG